MRSINFKERDAYGNVIGNEDELAKFLTDTDGGRINPPYEDIADAAVLDSSLLSQTRDMHGVLNSWTPPDGVSVYQVAGWGQDTVSGIHYYEEPLYIQGEHGATMTDQFVSRHDVMTVEDGDNTVVVPSALAMGTSSPRTNGYWLNLTHQDRITHGNIFKSTDLRAFLKNVITNSIAPLPTSITPTPPSPNDLSEKLRFFLHSPLTLEAYNSLGRHVGVSTTTGQFDQQIPGVGYDQFGEVKMLTVPADIKFRLVMNGYASGFFSLDEQQLVNGDVATTTGFIQIPTSTTTVASIAFDPSTSTAPILNVDEFGNGKTMYVVPAKVGASVTIDTTLPVTVATTTASSSNGWFKTGVAVTLIANDGPLGSGIAQHPVLSTLPIGSLTPTALQFS